MISTGLSVSRCVELRAGYEDIGPLLLSILTHRVAVARVLISGGGGNIMPDFLSTFVNK